MPLNEETKTKPNILRCKNSFNKKNSVSMRYNKISTVLFQTIHFSISTQFSVYTQLNVKIALAKTTQFSICIPLKCQTVLFDP